MSISLALSPYSAFENGILKPLSLLWDQVAEQAILSLSENETVSVYSMLTQPSVDFIRMLPTRTTGFCIPK